MLEKLKKYFMMLCLSYLLISIGINLTAFFYGASYISISSSLWIFVFCLISMVFIYIFDLINFPNLFVEILVKISAIYGLVFGGGMLVLGIIYKPSMVIALLVMLPVVIVIVHMLIYASELKDAKRINEKLGEVDVVEDDK